MITDEIRRPGNRRKLSAGLIIMVALCLLPSAAFSSDGPYLTLKAAALVEQDSIRLSDIAHLTNDA